MPVYHYSPDSLIDKVAIISNETGGMRACLRARAGASHEELAHVRAALGGHGWKIVPTSYDGEPVIEVRGFKKQDEVVGTLHAGGWTHAQTSVTPLEHDTLDAKSKRRNSTLKFAGLSYLVGDVGYMYYAVRKYMMRHHERKIQGLGESSAMDALDIVGGVGYAAGSAALSIYGSRDQSQNTIQSAGQKVKRYLGQQQIAVEKDSALSEIVKEPKRGLFGSMNHWMAKYPSETLNGIYVLVGGALTAVGLVGTIKIAKTGTPKEVLTEVIETGLGLTTAASAIAGLTIKEKKPIEGEEKRKGLGGVIDWIQEKPLRATGYGYMLATAFHGVGTVRKYFQKDPIDHVIRKTIVGRGVFVVANVVSEVLLTVSSKGHGNGVKPDASVDKTVMAATLETILRSDPAKQDELVNRLAGYLASQDVLGGKADEIAADMRVQLQNLKNNPWVKHHAPAATLPATTAAALNEVPRTQVSAVQHNAHMAHPQLATQVQ